MNIAVLLSFALNVLLLGALLYQAHLSSKERQSLTLLVKSRDVQEFVRAEQTLAAPAEPEEPKKSTVVPFDAADPAVIAAAMEREAKPPTE